jgi:hypothetical protein
LQEALRRAESKSEPVQTPESRPEPRLETRLETRPEPAKASPEARLQKLQELYKKGLLDKKEFDAKKAEILKEL